MKKLFALLAVAALALSASAQSNSVPVYSPIDTSASSNNPILEQAADLVPTTVVSPELKTAAISFVQNVEQEKSLTLAIYPTYAPGITTSTKDKYGAGVAAMYPLNGINALSNNIIAQHTFAGLRFDLIGGKFFASTVALGAKADFQLWGHNFEVFGESGANIPLSGAQQNTLAVGAMVGSGIQTRLCTFGTPDASGNRPGSLSVFGVVEKWTLFPGYVFHPGVAATWSF